MAKMRVRTDEKEYQNSRMTNSHMTQWSLETEPYVSEQGSGSGWGRIEVGAMGATEQDSLDNLIGAAQNMIMELQSLIDQVRASEQAARASESVQEHVQGRRWA